VQIIHERCAALDIGKSMLVACVRRPDEGGSGREQQVRSFATFLDELEQLRDWLVAEGVTHVAMEATGPYWKPVVRHEAPLDRERMKGPLLRVVAAAC
jgi:transposase